MTFTLACYETDPFQTAAISPDGRFLALTTAQHVLGVLDLERRDPIKIYTRQAGTGLAWSPDSQKLVFVDEPESGVSTLMLADVIMGKIEPLLKNSDWKGWPAWLAGGRIAYLSDRQADDVNVWTFDLKSRALACLIHLPNDISRIWGSPSGDALALQTVESGSTVLQVWHAADGHSVRLFTAAPGDSPAGMGVAFASNGRALAASNQQMGATNLMWFDAASGALLDGVKLPRPAPDLAVMNDGRVAAGQGDTLALWRPRARWYERTLNHDAYHGSALTVLGARGPRGVAVALNHNIVLAADKAEKLADGQIQPCRVEDELALAWGLLQNGNAQAARVVLAELQSRTDGSGKAGFLLPVAWAELERRLGHWRPAERWLEMAVRAAAPGGVEEEAAWMERLAMAAFDVQDRGLANWVLDKMPAGLDHTALAAWTKQLEDNPQARGAGTWIEIGGALRAGADSEAARLVNELVMADEPTTLTLRGISLILGGDFEPLGEAGNLAQQRLQAIMAQPEFQIALLELLRRNLPGGPALSDLNSLLLGQWVRQGDFSSARELVRDSLGGSAEAIPEYLEMLRRFLVIEERDRWQQRTVTDVLLAKDIAESLNDRLKAPGERLTLRLAQVKKALIEGDAGQAQAQLGEVRKLKAQREAADNADGAFEEAQNTFLTQLFKAKVAERYRQWDPAIQSYRACDELMTAVPGSWDVSPFEVSFMAELLATGSAKDPDLLRSYLDVLRGAGDPLVNPTHAPATIDAGLSNLATLRRVASDAWVQPYLSYTMGLYRSLAQQSWRALDDLRLAERQQPGPALLARITLEAAAVRDSLGQHALAARLYRRIYEAETTPAPQRAAAIQAAIQAEAGCGAIASPTRRLKDILKDDKLPQPWKAWLWMQQGEDDDGGVPLFAAPAKSGGKD